MSGAEKNIFAGIGWFVFGCVMTAISPDSFFWGAMVVGVIQFIIGLFGLASEANENRKTDQKIENVIANSYSNIKTQDILKDAKNSTQTNYWEAISPTQSEKAFIRAMIAVKYDMLEGEQSFKISKIIGQVVSQLMHKEITTGDYLGLYDLHNPETYNVVSEMAFLQADDKKVFGRSLMKAIYLIILADDNDGVKATKLFQEFSDYFNLSASENSILLADSQSALKGLELST